MRWLALLLGLAAGVAHGAVSPGTLALWSLDNVVTDASGNGYTLTNSGPVSFVTTPPPPTGTYCAGTYSGTAHFTNSAVRAALSGSTTYTIEGYLYTTNRAVAAEQQFLGAGSAGTAIVLVVKNDGAFKFVFDDARALTSATNVVTDNNWYYFAMVVNGTSVKGYIGTPGSTPTLVIDSTDASPESPTAGDYALGGYPLAYAFLPPTTMYLSNVRISNVARTSLPTADLPNTLLSPYVSPRQSRFPLVSPRLF